MTALSFSTIAEAAQLFAALETGGSSALLTEAGQQALSNVSTQAFNGSLTRLNISGDQTAARNAFASSLHLAAGTNGNTSELTQKVLDASYRHGGLADSMRQLNDSMTNLTIALGQQGQDTQDGGGVGENWLEAIAKAMGSALGKLSAKLVTESQQLNSLAGNTSAGGAQQFQATMAKFQADAQTLGMLSDAFANAIKSIGQGMQTMASKQ
jgi:hypothetical protein